MKNRLPDHATQSVRAVAVLYIGSSRYAPFHVGSSVNPDG